MMRSIGLITALGIVLGPLADAEPPAPLAIEMQIPLGDVSGRIDHLAIDLARQRLYIAELGNNSVGVVDLKQRRVVNTITGLSEPQGIAYIPATDSIYVANAGDGSVRIFNAADLTSAGEIALGDDADNVRVDTVENRVYVGYGSGALAVIDPATRQKIADIPLKAHPEGFQLESKGQRIFINIPDAHEIAVVDRGQGKEIGGWLLRGWGSNFPMALDESGQQIAVVFRHPAKLSVLAMNNGALLTSVEACGDADDVFVDSKRKRVYVSCGDGAVDTLKQQATGYVSIGRLTTASGARTSLYVPELDRLYVAVRATLTAPAALWILRPSP